MTRIATTLELAEREKEKAERKAKQATEVSRSLQSSLASERAMSQGLSERIKVLEEDRGQKDQERRELELEKVGLEDTVKDLMFSLEAGMKIQEMGGEGGEGGDLMIQPNQTVNNKQSTKGKKNKK